jgi:hypothetical protein
MLHCQAPETMGKDQDFPISVEAQLLGPTVKKDGKPLSEGYLAIQAESAPAQFRKIEIRELGE